MRDADLLCRPDTRGGPHRGPGRGGNCPPAPEGRRTWSKKRCFLSVSVPVAAQPAKRWACPHSRSIFTSATSSGAASPITAATSAGRSDAMGAKGGGGGAERW
jgi:hypothetical protein